MAETRGRIQDGLRYGELEIRLDGPMPLRSSDHFTIFGRGYAAVEDLREFIDHVPTYPDEALRTLFFFPSTRLYLPPYTKAVDSSSMEGAIIRVYGPPRFLRYEIYPDEALRSALTQTRYIAWASMQPGPSSEVGVFTTFDEFNTQAFDAPLRTLVGRTARPLPRENVLASIINDLYQFLNEKGIPMKAGTYTDGNLYIATWVDDGIRDVSQVAVGDAGLSHIIEVQQGVTHLQDVRVVGRLPQGVQALQPQYLAFMPGVNREVTWSKTALGLVNGSIQPLRCDVEVVSGSGSERVQCSEVEYKDYQLQQTLKCSQGIPLEVSITVQ